MCTLNVKRIKKSDEMQLFEKTLALSCRYTELKSRILANDSPWDCNFPAAPQYDLPHSLSL